MNEDVEHAGLSEAELEAFDEVEYVKGREDYVDEEPEQKAEAEPKGDDAGKAEESQPADEPSGEEKPEVGEKPSGDEKPEGGEKPSVDEKPEGGAAGQKAEEAKPDVEQSIIPVVEVPDISNYEKEKNALLEERKRLRAEYREGSIEPDAYDEKLDEINDKLSELEIRRASAESAARLNEAVRVANYRLSVEKVKAEAKDHGIDYNASPGLLAMWDTYVKLLAQDPENGNKPAEWFLRKGHEMVLKELGRDVAPKKAASVKEAVSKRAPNVSAVSIATAPAAGSTRIDDEFASLDQLSGLALERALARMSPDAVERYLSQL